MPKEFYMIEVFPDSYSVVFSKNGEVSEHGGVYSGRGCLIAVYREGNEKTNTEYTSCRYNNTCDEIDKKITLLTPEKTLKKPLMGVIEKDLPDIIKMLGI